MRDIQIFILGFVFAILLIFIGTYIFERIVKHIKSEAPAPAPEPHIEYKFVHARNGKDKKNKIEDEEEEQNHFFQ